LTWLHSASSFTAEFMLDRSTLTCPPQIQGYYLHPFDCTKYVRCWNQQTFIESCTPGEIFSFSNQKCVPKDQCKGPNDHVEYLIDGPDSQRSLDISEDITCPPGSSGLHAHPFDCTKFLECANGQTFVQNCGPGTVFSTVINSCDFANKVYCNGRNSLSAQNPGFQWPVPCPQLYVFTGWRLAVLALLKICWCCRRKCDDLWEFPKRKQNSASHTICSG